MWKRPAGRALRRSAPARVDSQPLAGDLLARSAALPILLTLRETPMFALFVLMFFVLAAGFTVG